MLKKEGLTPFDLQKLLCFFVVGLIGGLLTFH